MSRYTFRVKSYSYYMWSSRMKYKCNIVLNGENDELCALWFEENNHEILIRAKEEAPRQYSFYYHYFEFPYIIDMLRNESPVWVHFNDDGGYNNSRISTDEEPVGEGQET